MAVAVTVFGMECPLFTIVSIYQLLSPRHETDEESTKGIVNDEAHIPYTNHGTGSVFNAGRL